MVLVPFTRWNWGAEDKITQSKGIVFPLFHSESYYNPRLFEKMPQRRTRGTELMDKILHWAVQSQSQWRSISTELSPGRQGGWPPHPSLRSGGCCTIVEEREVSWSWHHPGRTGPSMWRRRNHCSHHNLRQDLADRRMTNPVDPILSQHFPRKASYSSARITEPSASSISQAK